ncbi:hypothetical protein LCGC14_0846010 [marine sediment metagenome]|uniref:PepSY domain-containing protein n=1 Tax=marine sediment metagenome TaxID=412755 RepID=A0A0F9SIT0_9ZZZZ
MGVLKMKSMRHWIWIHKWSSLVSTIFLLMLSLTGLPLIFDHQINEWLDGEIKPSAVPEDHPRMSLDRIMQIAISEYPDKQGMFVSQERDDDRVWFVTLAPAPLSEDGIVQVAVDARTGEILAQPDLYGGVMNFIETLHTDMFLGFPGMFFLGVMGIMLILALISGIFIYAPHARRAGFTNVRKSKSCYLSWLDVHNALGIVTFMWFLVIGATGVINAWEDILIKQWQTNNLAVLLEPYKNSQKPADNGSIQAALTAAEKTEPERKVQFIAFPGTNFSSPHHYGVYMRGNTAATERMSKPILIDTQTTEVTASSDMPWYLKALQLSRPLHFGDFGGLTMQLLWTVLNLMTLIVLVSGLYLWCKKWNLKDTQPKIDSKTILNN